MKFIYQYRTPDNRPHRGVISAPTKEAVYATLKAKGVNPGRVEEAPGFFNKLFGKGKRWIVIVALLAVCAALVCVVYATRRTSDAALRELREAEALHLGSVHYAVPIPRQEIPGDRIRIEKAIATVSTNAAERFLARFAEPGRYPTLIPKQTADVSESEWPSESELDAVLSTPLAYNANELTERIDLKRMVEGLKRELAEYRRAGGTTHDYLAALVARQKKEVEIRDMAEKHLYEMFKPSRVVREVVSDAALDRAYAYWLKANANLQAMGIYAIELPKELRRCQMSAVDLEENR